MSVHLMTWNPISKKQGEEVVMVIFVSYTISCQSYNKNICIYQRNDSITRLDLLLSKYGQL